MNTRSQCGMPRGAMVASIYKKTLNSSNPLIHISSLSFPPCPLLATLGCPKIKNPLQEKMFLGKSLFCLPQLWTEFAFPPQTTKPVIYTTQTSKTVRVTSFERFQADVAAIFSFIFILTESLKNHIKSQKSYKIENPILLDST